MQLELRAVARSAYQHSVFPQGWPTLPRLLVVRMDLHRQFVAEERETSRGGESDRRNTQLVPPDRGRIVFESSPRVRPARGPLATRLFSQVNPAFANRLLHNFSVNRTKIANTPKAARRRWASRAVDRVQTSAYTLAKNLRMRSRPRSRFSAETAYEIRTWSCVPKPSPGTTTTWASCRSFRATSEAEFNPPRSK